MHMLLNSTYLGSKRACLHMLFVLSFGVTFFYTYFKLQEVRRNGNDFIYVKQKDKRYILQWELKRHSPFESMAVGNLAFVKNKCAYTNCYVTNDTSFLDESEFDAIVFNGREVQDLRYNQLPKRRSPKQKYIFGAMESADIYPVCDKIFDGFFNWTWTYKIDSDFRWGYITIYDLDGNVVGPAVSIEWPRELEPVGEDIINKVSNKSKAAAWFVSNCFTKSGREKFVEKVQKELETYGWKVDIYGNCGPLDCPRSISHTCYNLIEKDYYFYFAFENSFSEDYVTEKLMIPLNYYSVPVVYGFANYSRFLPPGSYLDAKKLGPKKLAHLMNEIISNKSLYHDFFRWKNHFKYKLTSFNEDICKLCEMINNEENMAEVTVWNDFRRWWNGARRARIIMFVAIVFGISLYYTYNYDRKQRDKLILKWELNPCSPFEFLEVGNLAFLKNKCEYKNCFVTKYRAFFDESKFDAIIFNGKEVYNFQYNQLPKRRSPKQKYIFAAMESADNYPVCNELFDGYFNWTWTYKIDSDFRWGYITIYDLDGNVVGPAVSIEWPRELEPVGEDIINRVSNKSKAAAWFVSNCFTKSGREKFVEKVQKELETYGWKVDIYGNCGPLDCPKSISHICFDLIQNDYYFYFSLENSFSEDYVSEKLLTALNYYTVPIVYGSANYSRFLPPGSYVDGRDLGPKKLAQRMSEIISNKSSYHDFFRWRNHYKYKETSSTEDICKLCEMMNNEEKMAEVTVWNDFRRWWNGARYKENC
ncbi:unnamed protein product, partial [Brenthis ino]